MKRLALILGGLGGFLCAVGFAVFLLQYIAGGAGSQVFGLPLLFFGEPLSSGSVLIGLVHVVGLGMACFLCFAVGAVLCAHGIVPSQAPKDSCNSPPNEQTALNNAN